MLAFLLLLSLFPTLPVVPGNHPSPIKSIFDLTRESSPCTSGLPGRTSAELRQRADAGVRPVSPDSIALANAGGPVIVSPDSPLVAVETSAPLAVGPAGTRLGRDPPSNLLA